MYYRTHSEVEAARHLAVKHARRLQLDFSLSSRTLRCSRAGKFFHQKKLWTPDGPTPSRSGRTFSNYAMERRLTCSRRLGCPAQYGRKYAQRSLQWRLSSRSARNGLASAGAAGRATSAQGSFATVEAVEGVICSSPREPVDVSRKGLKSFEPLAGPLEITVKRPL